MQGTSNLCWRHEEREGGRRKSTLQVRCLLKMMIIVIILTCYCTKTMLKYGKTRDLPPPHVVKNSQTISCVCTRPLLRARKVCTYMQEGVEVNWDQNPFQISSFFMSLIFDLFNNWYLSYFISLIFDVLHIWCASHLMSLIFDVSHISSLIATRLCTNYLSNIGKCQDWRAKWNMISDLRQQTVRE